MPARNNPLLLAKIDRYSNPVFRGFLTGLGAGVLKAVSLIRFTRYHTVPLLTLLDPTERLGRVVNLQIEFLEVDTPDTRPCVAT